MNSERQEFERHVRSCGYQRREAEAMAKLIESSNAPYFIQHEARKHAMKMANRGLKYSDIMTALTFNFRTNRYSVTNDEDALPFPFVALDETAIVFGSIPNRAEAVREIPPEFDQRNAWVQLAGRLWARGLQDASRLTLKNPKHGAAQWGYLKCWLGSFEPSREEKMIVCGWLLSLMLAEFPKGL